MIHYDSSLDMYTLIVQGAKISFPDLGKMITFAQKQYGIDLLTILN